MTQANHIQQIEFYTYESEVWYRTMDGTCKKLDENDFEVVSFMFNHIRDNYPEAFAALDAYYKKLPFDFKLKRFRIVNMFCKCNFGQADQSKFDIDKTGTLQFENVPCPLRGECPRENIVCHPHFNSHISDSEMRVLKLVYEGWDIEPIADKLYLSPFTVRNHIRNAYERLGIHEKAEFVKYADAHDLFNKDNGNGKD
ncbi:MAG: helix-turn-helix transcriptional regulator [Bacteroidales bacterium]|jgi:DNA-binding CsgD family transcriptional regulator|nr:helix-turn-helix transcriptional regulator [Bacteroidales bacterium]